MRGVLFAFLMLCEMAVAAVPSPMLLSFAGGQVTCVVELAEGEGVPAGVSIALPLAMKTALEMVSPPASPARLTVRMAPRPRLWMRFHTAPFASQEGDVITLRADADPVKLAFRLGHEFSHWLVWRGGEGRPPLWLDEGLAQCVGAAAAAAVARTRKQSAERSAPKGLARNLLSLEELTGRTMYPEAEAVSAAYYWQAEELVKVLMERLGTGFWREYVEAVRGEGAADWQRPLRERYYFNDGDFEGLARRIRPLEARW